MKIICLHQSADLYGSDRSFLQVIKYFVFTKRFTTITVVLPRTGPLSVELEKLGVEMLYIDLSLLSKTYLKSFKWGKIINPLFDLPKKRKLISAYDYFYVNTSVILDFYLLAPILQNNKFVHVREIPNKLLSVVLSFLLRLSKATVIFNSKATLRSFSKIRKTAVIYNAFEGFEGKLNTHRNVSDKLRLLLIGRINTWKGQDFVIDALSKFENNKNVVLRIVGDTSVGNEYLIDELKVKVSKLGLTDIVEFKGFEADPSDSYEWADIILIPSKKPEPFGRIAIEAMSLSKPVIACNHGGLPEIILDGVTGLLFEPNNIQSFNKALRFYEENRLEILTQGVNGFRRYKELFSIESLYSNLNRVIFNDYVE